MLTINPSEVIWTVINFFLLLFLLRKFLFKPILDVLDRRQAKIDGRFSEAEAIRGEISEYEAEAARKIEAAQKEADDMIAAARGKDMSVRSDLLKEAQETAKTLRGEADQTVAAMRLTEKASLARDKDELARLLAVRLLTPATAGQEPKGA